MPDVVVHAERRNVASGPRPQTSHEERVIFNPIRITLPKRVVAPGSAPEVIT